MEPTGTSSTIRASATVVDRPGDSHRDGMHQDGPKDVLVERLDDGIVAIRLIPGTRITHADTLIIRDRLIDVFNSRPASLMVQLAGVATIDREAMTLYAQALTVSALAIVGSSPVDRVVAHRLVGMTSPVARTGTSRAATKPFSGYAQVSGPRRSTPNQSGLAG